ncbi:endonuclease domain-containing protein [Micromonospora palomenae]|uniref:endonuclease domain-containing protein n=1 Tax=Micromonospora palomenae TaxID=1461247 RepID=UPI003F8AC818
MVLREWQKDRCAICARGPFARGPNARRRYVPRLVVDHDHSNGLIRGLLCPGCNHAEGRASTKATRYVGYRQRPPTAILGIIVPYVSSFQPEAPKGEALVARFRQVSSELSNRRHLHPEDRQLIDELLTIARVALRLD